MYRLFLLTLLLVAVGSAADAIYRTTDAQGNVVFTDAPSASSQPAQPVEIQRTNTVPPVQIRALPEPDSAATQQDVPPPYTVVITSPENETSFPMGPGNFSVSVNVTPALEKYEGLQLFVDGEPWGAPQRDTLWDLINVFRGRHDLTVAVVNKAGETLVISAPVRVFVHRPSSNFRNRKK